MNICIQNDVMLKERDTSYAVITLRLAEAEAERFWRIMDAAKARNFYISKSDAYRELLGLNPPDVLTKGEIEFFRSGKKEITKPKGLKLPARSKSGSKPRINHKELEGRETGASTRKEKPEPQEP